VSFLFFTCDCYFVIFRLIFQYPVCKNLLDHVPEEKLAALKTSLGWMSDMLQETGWASLCHISLSHISSFFVLKNTYSHYQNIIKRQPNEKSHFPHNKSDYVIESSVIQKVSAFAISWIRGIKVQLERVI
jgi:hypothetical protein